jgi:hypothetical protein
MTDTFPSGAPRAGANRESQGSDDVTSALTELERKLRELEQELTSIGRRRMRAEVTEEPEAPAQATGRLVDERIEPGRAAQAADEAIEWASPAERATPVAEQTAAPGLPPRPSEARRVSPNEASLSSPSEARLTSPSDARLASLAELRSFRDRVERFAKELTEDYDAMLGRVMSGLSGQGSSEATNGAERGPEEAIFEGRVELGVGPFYDIASLGAFEQSLAALPCVSDVAVRRFEASHAVVDLRLAAPVALVSELRRALQADFNVRQVAEGRMLLTFDEA